MATFINSTFSGGTGGADLNTFTDAASSTWARVTAVSTDPVIFTATSGRIRPNIQSAACQYYGSGTPTSNEYIATGTVFFATAGTSECLVCVRMDTAAITMYTAGYDAIGVGGITLYKYVANSGSQLANIPTSGLTALGLTAPAASASHTIAVWCYGTTPTTLRVYYDNVLVLQYVDSSSPITTAGKAGLRYYTTETLDDSHTPQFSAFTAADKAAPSIIAPNDANLFGAPYASDVNGSTWIQSQHQGWYIRSGFTNSTTVAVNLDVSPLTGAVVAAANYPILRYAVDDGTGPGNFTDVQLTPNTLQISLATGLVSANSHKLHLFYKSSYFFNDMWNTPVNVIRVTGIELDNGGSSVAPTTRGKRLLIYGDSLVAAGRNLGNGDAPSNHDAYQGFAEALSYALQAEYGILAFGGQGWQQTGAGNAPDFYNATDALQSWNKRYSGNSLLTGGLFTPAPDYILVNHGYNDGSNDVSAAVQAWLSAVRAAAGAACQIVVWLAPSGRGATAKTGFNNYVAANPTDQNVHLVDFNLSASDQALINGSGGGNDVASDGTHWWNFTHQRYGARLAALFQQSITPPAAPMVVKRRKVR